MQNTSRTTLLILATVLFFVLVFMNLVESQGNFAVGMNNLNWLQIPISLVIGFLLGIVFAKKRRNKIWY
jgi:hypothetical protein